VAMRHGGGEAVSYSAVSPSAPARAVDGRHPPAALHRHLQDTESPPFPDAWPADNDAAAGQGLFAPNRLWRPPMSGDRRGLIGPPGRSDDRRNGAGSAWLGGDTGDAGDTGAAAALASRPIGGGLDDNR
jgi:hypothetical protein